MSRSKFIHSVLLMVFLVLVICAMLTGCKEQPLPKSGVARMISGNDIAGEYVSLSQLKNKVVILYFWSSKCCGDKLKQLEPFYRRNKDNGLSILAIEVGGSRML